MEKVIWESVELKQSGRRCGEAFASIGQGRIALNADACDLLNNIYDYEWVNVLQAKISNKVIKIGLRFTKDKEKNSIRVSRRKYKGEIVDGININCKELVNRYFGETKQNTSRYNVERFDENTIAVDILNEL